MGDICHPEVARLLREDVWLTRRAAGEKTDGAAAFEGLFLEFSALVMASLEFDEDEGAGFFSFLSGPDEPPGD